MKRPPVVHYRLARSSPAIKVLTTGSLVFILVGIAIVLGYAIELTGLSPMGIGTHYAGGEDPTGQELFFALSREELLRITHVHTFGMGMLLYIYGHMFTLTGRSEETKVRWISAMILGLAAWLGSLWLTAYVSKAFVWLFLSSFLASLLSLGAMAVMILMEIWLVKPKAPQSAEPQASGGDSDA